MKRRFTLISFVILVSIVLGACAGSGRSTRRLGEVRNHWNATVALENQAEGQYLKVQTTTNEGYQSIKNQFPLADQCFESSGNVIREAVEGRYDTTAGEQAPSGEVNTPALINALVVSEAYPGDITVCQNLKVKVADAITVWRQSRLNEFGVLWDLKVQLDGQYQGDLYRSLAVDLLQYAESEAKRLGVPVPDYVYPTFHLEAHTRDEAICSYYDTLWNPALNECVLKGQPAYDFIFRPVLAAEVSESFDSGVDDLDPLAPPEK